MTGAGMRGSIRRRLFLQLAAIAALLSLALFWAVRGVAERAASDTQDDILAASAIAIADSLRSEDGRVTLELPYSALSMLGTINEDRVFYRVVANGRTLTGYDDFPVPGTLRPGTGTAFETFAYRGDILRAAYVVRPVGRGGRPVDVAVAVGQTRLGMEAISTRITSTAVVIGIGFFLVATALSLFAARSALAPLNRMTQSVTRRGPKDLRPVETAAPAELVPFVQALNGFMGRLRASLSRSEDLIAEAAHRVRTPLATVRAQAEVTHRKLNKPEHKQAIREMIRAIDESSRSAGQLLDHAMVTFRTDSLELQALDLAELLADTCDRLSPTAELKDIRILRDIPAGPVTIEGDYILLQSALRNILDNAIKYSPADSTITATLRADGPITLSIRDQGRGFADADTAHLTQRFARGSNVTDIVGSGLGLTIADEVVRAHGGRIVIAKNDGGNGACVSLELPLP